MFCTGRIRHKGMPGGRSEAHSRRRASNGRGHGEADPCAESGSCYASIRGGFEEQMKRALNDRQRMERDDVIPTSNLTRGSR